MGVQATKTRRSLQVLWSKLDLFLAPHMPRGVLVAVSGGPDSRALMESLALWEGRNQGPLHIATFDHGMRSESKKEAELVALRAKRLGFFVHHESFFSAGALGEQELRDKRYRALMKICNLEKLGSICTAHHQGDNAEGFVMALLGRGGGYLGAAMSETAPLGQLKLLRPFLSLNKNDLVLALSMLGQNDYASDRLDENRVGQRAYVRHEIIANLQKHEDKVVERLSYFARKQSLQNQTIKSFARSVIELNEESALISAELCDQSLLNEALHQALAALGGEKDLRQARPTIEKIIAHFYDPSLVLTENSEGLDRPLKRFNVKGLKTKEYSLPGVVVKTTGTKIAIRRV